MANRHRLIDRSILASKSGYNKLPLSEWLKTEMSSLTVLEAVSMTQVWAGPCPLGGAGGDDRWQPMAFLAWQLHHSRLCLLTTWFCLCLSLRNLSLSIPLIGFRAHLVLTNYICKGTFPNHIHSIGVQPVFWGQHRSTHNRWDGFSSF